MGRTDSHMTLDGRIMAKDLTVYMVTVRTMGACQVKNRELVPQKDSVNGSPLLPNCFFY